MSDDNATLKDVTVEPNPSSAAAAKEPADNSAKVEAKPVISATDADAAEIGRIILESGFSKDQVNSLLEAPGALQSMRYMIQNNPREFLNLIERADPASGSKLLEELSSVYVERYAPKDAPGKAGGSGKSEPGAELMAEVEALRTQVQSFQTEKEQERARAATAQVAARYNGRVDDLFSQLPKEVELTKTDRLGLRALLDKELAADPNVVQRVSNGNFVDVPRKFQSIIESWGADRKATAQAAKDARDGVVNRGSADLSSGPNPFIPNAGDFDGSWDSTEDAFAKALTQASRS